MKATCIAYSLALSLPVLLAAPSALAADSAAAQALFDQGKALLAEGKATEACPKFAESQRLDPGVGTQLNLAACYESAGQLASAWTTFLEAESSAHAEGNAEAEKVAHDRAAALGPKLAKVVINVQGADKVSGLEVRRDGVVVGPAQWGAPIPADPGQHVVEATAPGHAPVRIEVTVNVSSGAVDVNVPPLAPVAAAPAAPPPAAPPADQSSGGLTTQHYLAIGAGVVGVAGIAVGTIFGLSAKSKHDSAESHCDGANCRDVEGVDLRNEARSAGNLSTVGFIVGGVGLAGAAALWFTAGPTSGSGGGATALRVSPTSVMLTGRF